MEVLGSEAISKTLALEFTSASSAPIDSEHEAPDKSGLGEAVLLPHNGILALDEVGAKFRLTNLVSYESQWLPEGHQWTLEYDDDGFGCCVSGGGELVVYVEQSLKYEVYKSESLGHVLVDRSGPHQGQHCILRHFMRKHIEVKIELPITDAKLPIELSACVLRWPMAPAAKVFISAKSIYEALHWTQFQKQPWRWIHGSFARWKKDAKQLLLGNHILRTLSMAESCMFWQKVVS